MPTGQQYATNVPQTQLSGAINNVAASFTVASATGWPTPPFTAILDIGNSNQEAVDVTSVVGAVFNCTRGIDGTTAVAHANQATVTHGNIGRDFREARAHIDAFASNDSTGHSVHGLAVSSSVVGTTDTQTLTNKTLTTPIIAQISNTGTLTLPTSTDTLVGRATTDTLTNKTLTSPTINGAAFGGSSTGTLATLTQVTATTVTANGRVNFGASIAGVNQGTVIGSSPSGPPTSGTFVSGDMIYDLTYNIWWRCSASGTPGTWTPMAATIILATGNPTGSNSFTVSIPAALQGLFNTLRVEYTLKTGVAASSDVIRCRLNGDSGSNYDTNYISYTQTPGTVSNQVASAGTSAVCGLVGGNSPGAAVGSGSILVHEIGNSSFAHQIPFKSVWSDSAGNYSVLDGGGNYRVASAITSITVLSQSASNFSSGSHYQVVLA